MHGSVHGWWVGGGDVVMCVGGILNAVLNLHYLHTITESLVLPNLTTGKPHVSDILVNFLTNYDITNRKQ